MKKSAMILAAMTAACTPAQLEQFKDINLADCAPQLHVVPATPSPPVSPPAVSQPTQRDGDNPEKGDLICVDGKWVWS